MTATQKKPEETEKVRLNIAPAGGFRYDIEGTITEQDVDNIVTAALESGVQGSGWATKIARAEGGPAIKYLGEFVAKGGVLKIQAEGDKKTYEVTADKIALGIVKAAIYLKRTVRAFIDDHDAPDADVALQLAIFPEVIYG